MTTPSARAVLAIGDFRSFLSTRFLSAVALQMVGVAVGWQVYDLTRDPLHLGLVGLAQFVPALACALPAGHVADRFDRRRVLLTCLLAETACLAALLMLSLQSAPPLALLLTILAVMGATRAFIQPASQSLVPHLVPTELFPRAVAWASSSWQVAVIAGPALGGALYAFGVTAVYAAAAAMMALAALAVSRLKTRLIVHAATETGLDGLLAGVRYVMQRRDILGAVSLDLFAVLLGGATALLPIYARDILHVGPVGLGLLRSAPAAGAALTAFWLAHHPLERHAGQRMFVAVGVFGLATVAFGLSTNYWLSLGALGVLGAADMISVVVRQTLVQARTPDEMRGRVSAVNFVFIGASNELGEFESGVTAALFGTVPAVVIGGVGTLAVAMLWAWRFPALRKVDRLV
ncbi:MAG TPA: MFS transporter [Magnetospirillum sp.]|nr:MFS transporter [Magnetospirillum sp.]